MEFQSVVEIAVDLVKTNSVHEDYQRTVDIAKDYRKIITTEGLTKDLEKTRPVTETDEMFKDRCSITHFTTKSIASNIKEVFYEVGKSENLQKLVEYSDDTDNKKKQELQVGIKEYAGSKSLEGFLGIDLVDLVFEDPNAFIVTSFEDFDSNTERAKPYPVVYYSESVQDYLFKNNLLEYLIVKKQKTAKNKGGVNTKIDWFFIYHDEINIKIEQRPDNKPLPGEQFDNDQILGESGVLISFKSENKIYDLSYYEHQTGFVSAVRAGYKTDPQTRHRTYLGPLEPAMPHFNKSIKIGSELDATISKHAHPKEYRYVTTEKSNKSAADIAADVNAQNGGAPKSAMEVTEITLPSGAFLDDDLADLKKLAYTHHLPVEFVKWLSGHVDAIEAKCKKAVFNSDTFERDTTVSTATEKRIERDSINATLKPFGDKYSETFKLKVKIIAEQMDLGTEGLSITHSFFGEFKSVSVEELIDQLKLLEDSNAPSHIKEKVASEIIEKQFKDDPIGLRTINIKAEHNPMKGKSKEEIMFLLSSNHVDESTKILYSNFDEIFAQLEIEYEDFYLKNFKDRKALIDQKIQAIKEKIPSNTAFVPELLGGDE